MKSNKNICIESYRKIHFPNILHHTESHCIVDDKLYVPLNGNESPGLYFIDLMAIKNEESPKKTFSRSSLSPNSFNLKFIYPSINDFISGIQIKNNIFVGCNIHNNTLLIYNIESSAHHQKNLRLSPRLMNDPRLNGIMSGYSSKSFYYIQLIGSPVNVCFSEQDQDCVFCVINANIELHSGILIKVNIKTGQIDYLVGLDNRCYNIQPLFPITGLTLHGEYLYISSMTELYRIHVEHCHDFTKLINIYHRQNDDYPFYHHISVFNNVLNIAIFDYNKKLSYHVFRQNYISTLFAKYCSCWLNNGETRLNKKNMNYNATKKHIKFVQFDTSQEISFIPDFITFQTIIPHFDNNITKITQLSSNQYLLTNFKTSFMIVVNTK